LAWNGPKWTASWHNFAQEATSNFSDRIEIYDWTLEGDGEEMPGIVFTKSEKLEIAKMLDAIHTHRINIGSLNSAPRADIEAITEIAHLGLSAKIEAFVGVNKSDVDLALKTDVPGILMELPSSDAWITKGIRRSREQVLAQSLDVITYAKEHGLGVTFGLQDATRTDETFLKEYVQTLSSQSKLDVISIADSMAVSTPEGFKHLIRLVTQWTKLPVAIHCHNDFGLATANALAGLSAGADIVTTTANGIGERCGLTSLEEIAVALRILYNIDIGIRLEKLCELSRLVERATGPVISSLKAVVGERAFAWEADGFVERTRNLQSAGAGKAALPYEPDLVGNDFKFYPGKKVGREGIKWESHKHGFDLTDEQVDELMTKTRTLASAKAHLSEQAFLAIVKTLTRQSRRRS
jgi:methanogen homocitrate synthase